MQRHIFTVYKKIIPQQKYNLQKVIVCLGQRDVLFLTLQFGFVFEKMASILSSPVFVNGLQKIACVENEIK